MELISLFRHLFLVVILAKDRSQYHNMFIPNDHDLRVSQRHLVPISSNSVDWVDVRAVEAWNVYTGENDQDCVVAVIGSGGCDWDHFDMKGKWWKGMTPGGKETFGFDFETNTQNDSEKGAFERDGTVSAHTFASTVVGSNTNNKVGGSSLHMNCKVMCLTVKTQNLNQVVAAVEFASNKAWLSVLMKECGCYPPINDNDLQRYKARFDKIQKNGHLVIQAASNAPDVQVDLDLPWNLNKCDTGGSVLFGQNKYSHISRLYAGDDCTGTITSVKKNKWEFLFPTRLKNTNILVVGGISDKKGAIVKVGPRTLAFHTVGTLDSKPSILFGLESVVAASVALLLISMLKTTGVWDALIGGEQRTSYVVSKMKESCHTPKQAVSMANRNSCGGYVNAYTTLMLTLRECIDKDYFPGVIVRHDPMHLDGQVIQSAGKLTLQCLRYWPLYSDIAFEKSEGVLVDVSWLKNKLDFSHPWQLRTETVGQLKAFHILNVTLLPRDEIGNIFKVQSGDVVSAEISGGFLMVETVLLDKPNARLAKGSRSPSLCNLANCRYDFNYPANHKKYRLKYKKREATDVESWVALLGKKDHHIGIRATADPNIWELRDRDKLFAVIGKSHSNYSSAPPRRDGGFWSCIVGIVLFLAGFAFCD